MEVKEYPVMYYGKSELARAYTCGRMSDGQARVWLMREIAQYPGLMDRLVSLGYTKNSKVFTRAQVEAIYEAIGEP